MLNYILKRIGFALLALFILITLIFFLTNLLPGFPIEKSQQESNEEFFKRLEGLGLTKPVVEQYALFWKKWITTGQFGTNYRESISIEDKFLRVMPYTMALAGIAFVLSVIIGVFFGVLAAVYRGRWQDTLINVVSVFFLSVPSFVVATFLIRWAADGGWPITFPALDSSSFDPIKLIKTSLLPISALVSSLTPTIVYYTRNEMVDVLNQDYVKTALSKGLTYPTVLFKHCLRNASIPVLSVIIPSFLIIVGGSIIIEKFYGVPGIANQLVDAVQQKQIYLLMFNALVISGIYFALQIFADVLYTFIDPRIKLAKSNSLAWYMKLYKWSQRNIWFLGWEKLFKNKNFVEIFSNSSEFDYIQKNRLIANKKLNLNKNDLYYLQIDPNLKWAIIGNQKYKIVYNQEGGV
ncbi:ABC transporter permease [Malacoplasma iowae]|uniref:ABC transporter permease n=1 Tax=Malacoplasma iowae TaxID=2116 RepID=UPI002A189B54|nr:ABC transporter permease [Malacoplasma iowae]WPL38013.1 ABC transporter permease [Malacoplasma iowae]